VLNGADCPLDSFFLGQKRRTQQDERPHGDVVSNEELRGAIEIVDRHLLVERGQDLGMDRL
jgi:hypothetical protein